MTTCAPQLASSRATASPIPRDAPVTSAVLPPRSNNAGCVMVPPRVPNQHPACRIGESDDRGPRTGLITGAGSGLGLALARRHARRGDAVACVDIDGRRAEAARIGL